MQEVSRSGFELSIPSFRGFKLFNIFSRGYQTEMNHIHRSYSTDLHDANVHATWVHDSKTSDVAKVWNISDIRDFRGF